MRPFSFDPRFIPPSQAQTRGVGWVGPIPPPNPRVYAAGATPLVGFSPLAGTPDPRTAGRPVVGWTTPSLIYEKMRTIERTAQDLVPKAHTYVDGSTAEGAAYLRALDAWDAQWTPFYQKYQSDSAKLGAVFDTDGLNKQTEEFRSQLLALYDQYERQKQPNGQPVPVPQTPAPTPQQDAPPAPAGAWSWPWWVWLGIGAGLVGGAWWLYRRYVQVQAQKKILQEEVLPGLIGPGLAHAAAAGSDASRDPDAPRGLPSLGDYARSGFRDQASGERALVYRPYEHPHLISGSANQRISRSAGRRTPADNYARRRAQDAARDRQMERLMESERDPYARGGMRTMSSPTRKVLDSVDRDWGEGEEDEGEGHDFGD